MSARLGGTMAHNSTQRGTIVTTANDSNHQRNNNSHTLTDQTMTPTGSNALLMASANAPAISHIRNRTGFVSLNQPSMISNAIASEGEIENATEIIEESSHVHSKRDSAFNESDL